MLRAAKGRLKEIAARFGLELRANANVDPFRVKQRLVAAATPVIFDVGAHVGQTSLEYRRHFPRARLLAFEPFPPSYAKLQDALAGDAEAEAIPLAFSDSIGSQTLHVNPAEATNSLLATDPTAAQTWGTGLLESHDHVTVATSTIDEFCRIRSLAQIDILKLDVQGAEFAVLSGAASMLAERRIGLVYLEVIVAATYAGQRRPHEYLQWMEEAGYQWVDLFNPLRGAGRLLQFDLLFAAPALLKPRPGR